MKLGIITVSGALESTSIPSSPASSDCRKCEWSPVAMAPRLVPQIAQPSSSNSDMQHSKKGKGREKERGSGGEEEDPHGGLGF